MQRKKDASLQPVQDKCAPPRRFAPPNGLTAEAIAVPNMHSFAPHSSHRVCWLAD